MRNKTRILIGVLAMFGVAGAWWWLEHSTRPEIPAAIGPGETRALTIGPGVPALHSEGSSVATGTQAGTAQGGGEVATMPESTAADGMGAVADAAAPSLTAGDILAEPDENYVRVAKKLSALVLDPRASMADREEALAHALNLSAGNEAEVLTPLVTNPVLPDNLTETILAEALNRPLAYQADLYLAALAARKTPEMQKLIREHLAFLTGGEDLGSDPKAWVEPLNTAKKGWDQ